MITLVDAEAALGERTNLERTGVLRAPTLDRMRFLADVLGSPQDAFGVIGITGTNGKSTAAVAASALLRAAGLRIGSYLSPHVSRITERVWLDLAPISDDEFAEAWEELAPILEFCDERVGQVSWFEAMTGLALLVFADRGLDVAVLEVGMGGIWDATNVADAQIALALPVGHDHPVLGATPRDKAREKAGIVKAGATLVLAKQPEDGVEEVFRARADEVGATIDREGDRWELEGAKLAISGQVLTFRLGSQTFTDIFMPQFGRHAARSAVAGFAAASAFLGHTDLDEELVTEALAAVRLPGRLEVVRRTPLILIDGAHNAEAARALAGALPSSFRYEQLRVIVGAMQDKDLAGILEPLALLADEIICTRVDWPRAADPELLAEAARALGARAVRVITDPGDAIGYALEHSTDTDAILVAGSLYLAGAARGTLHVDRRTAT